MLSLPVTATASSAGGGNQPTIQQVCEVLELTLGPLDLNVAGLMVHLDTEHLLITADPTGGLLGSLLASLLCGQDPTLAELLGQLNTALTTVIGILNNILAALG